MKKGKHKSHTITIQTPEENKNFPARETPSCNPPPQRTHDLLVIDRSVERWLRFFNHLWTAFELLLHPRRRAEWRMGKAAVKPQAELLEAAVALLRTAPRLGGPPPPVVDMYTSRCRFFFHFFFPLFST